MEVKGLKKKSLKTWNHSELWVTCTITNSLCCGETICTVCYLNRTLVAPAIDSGAFVWLHGKPQTPTAPLLYFWSSSCSVSIYWLNCTCGFHSCHQIYQRKFSWSTEITRIWCRKGPKSKWHYMTSCQTYIFIQQVFCMMLQQCWQIQSRL